MATTARVKGKTLKVMITHGKLQVFGFRTRVDLVPTGRSLRYRNLEICIKFGDYFTVSKFILSILIQRRKNVTERYVTIMQSVTNTECVYKVKTEIWNKNLSIN